MGRRQVGDSDLSDDSYSRGFHPSRRAHTENRDLSDDTMSSREEAEQPRRVSLDLNNQAPKPETRQSKAERQTPSQPRRAPEKKPAEEKEPVKMPNIFADKRWRIFTGIFLFAIGGVMAIMLISHLRGGFEDQSLVENMSVNGVVESGEPVSNSGGALGAWIADVIFTKALGLGSIALVIYFLYLGVYLLLNRRIEFWSLTFKTLLASISISVILGFVTYSMPAYVQWGGIHGREVNKYLFDIAGPLGPISVSIVLFAALVCVYLNDLARLVKQWRKVNEFRRRHLPFDIFNRQVNNDLYTMDDDDEPVAKKEKNKSKKTDEEVAAPEPEPVVAAAEDEQMPAAPRQPVDLDAGFDIDDKPAVPAAPAAASQQEKKDGDVPLTVNGPKEEEESNDEAIDENPGQSELYDHRASLSRYRFPDINLLGEHPSTSSIDMDELNRNKERIVKTLGDYKITISSITATVGPTVTLYEIIPTEGTRISQITRLEDDISMSLAASGIRIIAPLPGKGTIGIEVPNAEPKTVWMRRMLESPKFKNTKMALPVALGATIEDEVFVADLAKMPHLLVAGATGQGKSVGLNVIITSLLYKKHPTELKLVLIDPKMVEFSFYEKLDKHYLAKLQDADDAIITSPEQALETLNSLCVEMDRRLALFKQGQAKNIEEYNARFTERKLNPEDGHYYMPYIVVIIDEFYDLMMTGGKDIEAPVIRITQKARAAGIHMIIATQRPSTNVLTGVIKANCPARIAFKVMQMVDSRTIIDRPGANKLIGRGDMLYTTGGDPERLQCAFITTKEIEDIVDAVNNQVGIDPYYLPEPTTGGDGGGGVGSVGGTIGKDPLFEEAARYIVTQSTASTSSLQRRYQIGYNRAGKIMDQMEAAGIVGAASGSKPRSVLVDSVHLEMILENS